jgi:hypothetical protein
VSLSPETEPLSCRSAKKREQRLGKSILAQIVNQTIYCCIWFAVVIVVLQLGKYVRRLLSGATHRVPVGQAGQKP